MRKQGIIQDYRRKVPIKKITKKWKIKDYQLYYLLKKHKVKIKRIPFYSDKDVNEMIILYKKGVSFKEIAKKFDTHKDSIYHILERRNFVFSRDRNRKIKEGYLNVIVNKYKEGLSTQQIAKSYGVTKSRIGYWLKKKGIKLKSPTEWNKSRRKKIKSQNGMTKDKALFLGLLLSDGSESKKANNITLAGKEKFIDSFGLELAEKIYGIKGREDKKGRRIIWHSENMKDDLHLFVYTIVHSPKIETHIPKEIINSDEFSKNFIKGYFSCDGSVTISISKDGRVSSCIALLSRNLNLANDISKILSKLGVRHINNNGIIQIASREGLRKFKEKINFLPVKIQKGKNWRGFRKDKLLEFAVLLLSKNHKKKFENKEEGYAQLKNLYENLIDKT